MIEAANGALQDKERFEQVALPHLDSVYRAAVALCGRSTEAEDLTQTTFVRAWERFDTFEPGTNCRALVAAATWHLSLSATSRIVRWVTFRKPSWPVSWAASWNRRRGRRTLRLRHSCDTGGPAR